VHVAARTPKHFPQKRQRTTHPEAHIHKLDGTPQCQHASSDPITPADLLSPPTELRSPDQGQTSGLPVQVSTFLGKYRWCWWWGLQLTAHWHNQSAVNHTQLYHTIADALSNILYIYVPGT